MKSKLLSLNQEPSGPVRREEFCLASFRGNGLVKGVKSLLLSATTFATGGAGINRSAAAEAELIVGPTIEVVNLTGKDHLPAAPWSGFGGITGSPTNMFKGSYSLVDLGEDVPKEQYIYTRVDLQQPVLQPNQEFKYWRVLEIGIVHSTMADSLTGLGHNLVVAHNSEGKFIGSGVNPFATNQLASFNSLQDRSNSQRKITDVVHTLWETYTGTPLDNSDPRKALMPHTYVKTISFEPGAFNIIDALYIVNAQASQNLSMIDGLVVAGNSVGSNAESFICKHDSSIPGDVRISSPILDYPTTGNNGIKDAQALMIIVKAAPVIQEKEVQKTMPLLGILPPDKDGLARLEWATASGSWRLEVADALAAPTRWRDAGITPTQTRAAFQAAIIPSNAAQFFHLRQVNLAPPALSPISPPTVP